MTSSLNYLPSGRSRLSMVSCFSMLSFVFNFAVFLAHHPVQQFFSWSSPSSVTIHSSFYYFSLKRFPCHYMSHPVPYCLVLIVVNRDLSSATSFNISFDMCSVQLIFSILRHTFISKASSDVLLSHSPYSLFLHS